MQIAETMEHAATSRRDGRFVGFETVAKYVTPALAYIVEVEQLKAKIGARDDITPIALRAAMIFRPEEGVWKVLHRRADQITTAQPVASCELGRIRPAPVPAALSLLEICLPGAFGLLLL
ncbi:MAG TPA: hypothetical protein VFI90_01960 [Rubrobacter sp.]|nr:hypothetical protein [Rubrobacter sp.]